MLCVSSRWNSQFLLVTEIGALVYSHWKSAQTVACIWLVLERDIETIFKMVTNLPTLINFAEECNQIGWLSQKLNIWHISHNISQFTNVSNSRHSKSLFYCLPNDISLFKSVVKWASYIYNSKKRSIGREFSELKSFFTRLSQTNNGRLNSSWLLISCISPLCILSIPGTLNNLVSKRSQLPTYNVFVHRTYNYNSINSLKMPNCGKFNKIGLQLGRYGYCECECQNL